MRHVRVAIAYTGTVPNASILTFEKMMAKHKSKADREIEALEKYEDGYDPIETKMLTAREKLKATLHQLADDLVDMFDASSSVTQNNGIKYGPVIMAPEDLAKRLGVTKSTLGHWRVSGSGPKFFKIGKKIYYRIKDVWAWAEGQNSFSNTSEKRD